MQNLITMSEMTLNEIKISSRDIASLTNKDHKNVKRDIETALVKDALNFERIYLDSRNREQTEYVLPKNIALGIVSGYSFDLRMKIINRLEELENKNIPLTFEEMAKQTIFLADKRIKELEYKIEADKPLVSFAKSIEASVDSVLISNYAKLLSDTENITIGQNKLFGWLRYAGYLMNGGDRHNVPYQKYVDNGYFEVSTSTFASSTGTHQRFTAKITGKGQIALAKKIVEAFSEQASA